MNENTDAIIGQLYQQLAHEQGQHRNTVGMLAALKRGDPLPDGRKLSLDIIVVDERAGAWQIAPPEPSDDEVDEHVSKAVSGDD